MAELHGLANGKQSCDTNQNLVEIQYTSYKNTIKSFERIKQQNNIAKPRRKTQIINTQNHKGSNQ